MIMLLFEYSLKTKIMYQIIQSPQDRRDFAHAKEAGVSLTEYKAARAELAASDKELRNQMVAYATVIRAKYISSHRMRG